MVKGTTNRFLLDYEACSTGGVLCLELKPCSKAHVWGDHRPWKRTYNIVILNSHIKLPSKYICLYSLSCVVLRETSFLQWVVSNSENYNCQNAKYN